MYGTAFTKKIDSNSHIPSFLTWQAEIRDMYRNYFLIDLILNQSTKLTKDDRSRYRSLQRELTSTLEQFLAELDAIDKHPCSAKQAIFSKHVNVMERLNKHVDQLVRQQPFRQQR